MVVVRALVRGHACVHTCACMLACVCVRACMCVRMCACARLAVVWLQVVPCYFCWSELKLFGCYLVLFGYCWVFLGCH